MKYLWMGAAASVLCAACTTVAAEPQATAPVIEVPATQDTKVTPDMPVSKLPSGWIAKSLPEIAEGLQTGQVKSVDLVMAYQDRIEKIDRNGPSLQSVLTLNPTALNDAMDSDERRMLGKGWGPLDGVPILLKDKLKASTRWRPRPEHWR